MIAIIIIGTIMMFAGIGAIFSAYLFPARHRVLQRCGTYLFIAGMVMWGIACVAV